MKSSFQSSLFTLGFVALVHACASHSPGDATPGAGGSDSGAGGETSQGGADVGVGGNGAAGGSSGNGGTAGSSGGTAGTAGNGSGSSSGAGSSSGSGGYDPADAGYPDVTFSYTPTTDSGGNACASVTGEGIVTKRPMDIIVVIDNSRSMAGEIAAVQQRINVDLAQIIADSGIDYRVVMVSRYANVGVENQGSGSPYDSAFGVCISPPLGSAACPADNSSVPPALALNPPRFYHHSTDIGSRNVWCRLNESFTRTDPWPNARSGWSAVAPTGWGAFLREDSFKVFIAISDDSPAVGAVPGHRDDICRTETNFTDDLAGANAFDQALRSMAASQFGAVGGERNYAWYSIVGMAGNATVNPTPLQPDAAVQTLCCKGDGTSVACPNNGTTAPITDGVRAGIGYQELSKLTGGLRYPSCFNNNFDDVFNAIAQGVIERAVVPCEYQLPEVDGIINVQNIQAEYQPSGGGAAVALPRVNDVGTCTGQQFYLDDNTDPTHLSLCPAACNDVQLDQNASVNIDFGCLGS